MVKKRLKKHRRLQKALFSTGAAADMPKTELFTEADLTDGNIDIMTLLVKCGLTASKSEARRAVQQGGVSVDGEKITDIAHICRRRFWRRRNRSEKRKEKFPQGHCKIKYNYIKMMLGLC